jgi:pilus assembly protein CpaD
MQANRCLVALILTLGLGACAPVTSYTDAEAPKRIRLDVATTDIDLRFAPGGAALATADAARLRQLAASGGIGPSDRVIVAASGPPHLAEERAGTVAALLLNYGIVAIPTAANTAANQGRLEVTRTLVTLPPCPNWSKPSSYDYGNQPSSNFGCATETDLGMMIASPSDLAGGLPRGGVAAQPAAAAVNRYLNDKVTLPTANTALPVATQNSNQQGSTGANGSSPTGTGTGGS